MLLHHRVLSLIMVTRRQTFAHALQSWQNAQWSRTQQDLIRDWGMADQHTLSFRQRWCNVNALLRTLLLHVLSVVYHFRNTSLNQHPLLRTNGGNLRMCGILTLCSGAGVAWTQLMFFHDELSPTYPRDRRCESRRSLRANHPLSRARMQMQPETTPIFTEYVCAIVQQHVILVVPGKSCTRRPMAGW